MRALPVPDVIDSSFGEFMAEVLASRRPTLADILKRARNLREACDSLSIVTNRQSAALVADEIDHLLRDFMACDLPADCDRGCRLEWLAIARDCMAVAGSMTLADQRQEAEESTCALDQFLRMTA